MSRTFHSILRGGLGAILVAGAAMAACGHAQSSPQAAHPLGESTAPLPTNSAAPLIDAPGVPDPSAPTPPATPPSGAWGQNPHAVDIATADELAVDAGVPRDPRPTPGPGSGSNMPRPTNPPNAPRPTNPGNGSGSGGNPLPAPGGPGVPPKAPSPTQPAPGPGTPPSTPTPGPR